MKIDQIKSLLPRKSERRTANHLVLTDDEVRLVEVAMANITGAAVVRPLTDSVSEKVRAFGLSRDREGFTAYLGGKTYRVRFQGGPYGAMQIGEFHE